MNDFMVFFITVSIFPFNVFCMNPSTLGLPFPLPPNNVEFLDCFVAHEITCEALNTEYHGWYHYNHICSKKLQFPEDELDWYIVGSLEGPAELSQDLPPFHYILMEQSLIKVVYLKGKMVELMFTGVNFEITFQSLEQSQAFYDVIHTNAKMTSAATKKIGLLHEIMPQTYKMMGKNVEALSERIGGTRYITLKSEQGKPLLIFSQAQSEILRIRDAESDRLQLLLRVRTEYYILTFSTPDEAKQFSQSLGRFLKPVHLGRIVGYMKYLFENNGITIDPKI